MSVNENYIEARIVRYARMRGMIAIKLGMSNAHGTVGWPDLILLGTPRCGPRDRNIPAPAMFFELKKITGRLKEVQAHRIDLLRGAKYKVEVPHTFEHGKFAIDRYIKEYYE